MLLKFIRALTRHAANFSITEYGAKSHLNIALNNYLVNALERLSYSGITWTS